MNQVPAVVTNWPEMLDRWLRALLRGRPIPAPQASEREWGDCLQALRPHDILPLLYTFAQGAPAEAWPPGAVMTSLQHDHATSMGDATCRWLELKHLLRALETADVQPIVLKGAALAESLYAGPELRPSADIDLLVRHEEYHAAREGLFKAGYALAGGDRAGQMDWNCHESFIFASGGESRQFVVELHWSLSPHTSLIQNIPVDLLFDRPISVSRPGYPMAVLHPIDALVYAALHLMYTHYLFDRRNVRLIWLYDIHLLAQRIQDHTMWQEVLQTSLQFHARLALLETLELTQSWFGSLFPTAIRDLEKWPPSELEMDLHAVSHSSRSSRLKRHLLRLIGLNYWEQVSYLKDRLLPDRREVDFAYPQLRSLPSPLAYLARPILSLIDPRNRRR